MQHLSKKNRKAPGEDSITCEIIKIKGPNTLLKVKYLHNADNTDIQNYRSKAYFLTYKNV